jgi:hypothetical protein
MRRWKNGCHQYHFRSWNGVATYLRELMRLLSMDDTRFLIVSDIDRNRFVQFKARPVNTFYGETISNDFLRTHERLSRTEERAIIALGWKRPVPRGSAGNFWRSWPGSVDLAEPVALALQTLRQAFHIKSPSLLTFTTANFDRTTRFPRPATLETPNAGSVPELPSDSTLRNAASGRVYRVGRRLGEGGFGTVYEVTLKRGTGSPFAGKLCLKTTSQPGAWHREAYFGELLRGVSRAVSVHESFACANPDGVGPPLHCLVSERAEFGDLGTYLRRHPGPWSEARARREIIALLRLMVLLHRGGAVHRDLTPYNVLVGSGRVLKLADFGIAMHRLGAREVPADVFNPGHAPTRIVDGTFQSWRAADDVYQIGQLFAMLLRGVPLNSRPTDVAALDCSPVTKAIIQRAIGKRRKRWPDAAAMLRAFEGPNGMESVYHDLDSLDGKIVVFTGRLKMLRSKAAHLVRQAGGAVKNAVGSDTDVVVQGVPARLWKASSKGQKLLDVDRERERGHNVAVITEDRFLSLVGHGIQVSTSRQGRSKRTPRESSVVS